MKKITKEKINDYLLGGIMMNGILAIVLIIVLGLVYWLGNLNMFEEPVLAIVLELNITLQILAICVKGFIKEEE